MKLIPKGQTNASLAKLLHNLFMNKITTVLRIPASCTHHVHQLSFRSSKEFVAKLITKSNSETCSLDPILTEMLKTNLDHMLPVVNKW